MSLDPVLFTVAVAAVLFFSLVGLATTTYFVLLGLRSYARELESVKLERMADR
jgi:hypothetical protein